MSSRTTTSTVPILNPFMVAGYADELSAGEYEVLADDAVIQSHRTTACRRTARILLINWPAGKSERRTMDQQNLELALAHDQANANTTVTKNSEAALSPPED